jgi:predicted MFS family arabinose efflux permease
MNVRRTLPLGFAYGLATSIIGLGLFASVTPSPLYRTYSVLWRFSPLMLTLIYATYAFGVLATLLLAGRASDQVGRRPVLLVSLTVLVLSSVLFIVARSVAWLFVARGLQGLATGAALSTASAAMMDLHPRRDPMGVALANGVASAGGLGLGILVSSLLVQLTSAPLVLPYVVLLILFLVAFVGVLFMPETVGNRVPFRLTPQRPSLPTEVRPAFLLASLAVFSAWSIGGMFFSLGPQLSAHLFATRNVILCNIAIVALAACAAVAQILVGRVHAWISSSVGSIALAMGVVLIVVAAAVNSSGIFVVGTAMGGVGFGMAFLGGLRALVVVIPPAHRAGVMSSFYIVAYASLSVPAVIAGLVSRHIGLERTFETFGSVVAVVAVLVALQAWRTRPMRSVATA